MSGSPMILTSTKKDCSLTNRSAITFSGSSNNNTNWARWSPWKLMTALNIATVCVRSCMNTIGDYLCCGCANATPRRT